MFLELVLKVLVQVVQRIIWIRESLFVFIWRDILLFNLGISKNQHVPRTALGCLEQSIAPWWERKISEFHDCQRERDKESRELGILEWIHCGSLGKSLTIAAYALQKSYMATHFIKIMDSHKICTSNTDNLSSLSLELSLQNKAH